MAKRSGQLFRIKKIPVARKTGRVFNSKNRNVDEQDCVSILIKFGYDVLFQAESKVSGVHTADILWKYDNRQWEIKTLFGDRYATIKHALDGAKSQSPYVVLYAEKTKRSLVQIAKDCKKYCDSMPAKVIKKIIVIDKDRYLLLSQNELYL